MFEIFGVPSQALFGQLLIGLINGSFYALLSLGLAVIFGMLNIINFTHGAQYMLGAFAAYLLLQTAGLNYWLALIVAPVVVGISGVLLERNLIAQLGSSSKLRTIILLGATAAVFLVTRLMMDPTPALAIAILCGFVIVEVWAYFAPPSDTHEAVDHLYGLLLT